MEEQFTLQVSSNGDILLTEELELELDPDEEFYDMNEILFFMAQEYRHILAESLECLMFDEIIEPLRDKLIEEFTRLHVDSAIGVEIDYQGSDIDTPLARYMNAGTAYSSLQITLRIAPVMRDGVMLPDLELIHDLILDSKLADVEFNKASNNVVIHTEITANGRIFTGADELIDWFTSDMVRQAELCIVDSAKTSKP